MEVVQVSIKKLKPYEKNAKKHPQKQIDNVAESIKEFGWQQPIVVDKDYTIIVGHGRYYAGLKLGCDEVPVVIAKDLTPAQVAMYRLLDNKLNESEWIPDFLKYDLQWGDDGNPLDFSNFDIDWGLEEETAEETTITEDDFEPEPPAEPVSKIGDIYQLGEHRLMCGDSTSEADVKKLMNGQLADLLVTDPPYNVDYEGGTGMKIENDKQEDLEFHKFLCSAFLNAKNSIKEGAGFYIWYASREVVNFVTALQENDLTVRQELIWNKNSLVLGRQDYQWKHEPCLYGWKDGGTHHWYGGRALTTVIDWDRPTKSELHPTMKPIGLFDFQIKNSSKKGELVLDLFGGSGTSIMACEQNGRKCYTMEYDPKYVDVIIKRWEDFTGKKAEKIAEVENG